MFNASHNQVKSSQVYLSSNFIVQSVQLSTDLINHEIIRILSWILTVFIDGF